jgi:hypothetical protein
LSPLPDIRIIGRVRVKIVQDIILLPYPNAVATFPHYFLLYFPRLFMLNPEARPKSRPADSGKAEIITR